jgi:hypothetical protein
MPEEDISIFVLGQYLSVFLQTQKKTTNILSHAIRFLIWNRTLYVVN